METNGKVVVVGVVIAYIGISNVYHAVKVTREEREKHREIRSNVDKELAALHRAHGRVLERIENGTYNGQGIDAIMNDFQFERIIERMKED